MLTREQLGTWFINSFSFHHLIITIINNSTIINSWEWYLQVLERRAMLRNRCYLDDWGYCILTTCNLEFTWTIHFEMICVWVRIIGLLQSQDLDGKPTIGFIVSGWSVNEMLCLKAPRGGIVLIIAEDDRVLWISTWFVETEDWDFRLIELFCLNVLKKLRKTVDCVFMETFSSRNTPQGEHAE